MTLFYFRRGSLGSKRVALKRERLKGPSRRRRVNSVARVAMNDVHTPTYKHIFWRRVANFAAKYGVK
jgi:hypothetical protein